MRNMLVTTAVAAVLVLALSGCAEVAGGARMATPVADAASAAAEDIVLSEEAELALGTLKLKDLGLAPDEAQASNLLFLWRAYQSLLNSDTAAEEEIQALFGQIRQAMTSPQLDAIAAMDIGAADLAAVMEDARANQGESGSFAFPGGQGGDFQLPEGAVPFGGGDGGGRFAGPPGGQDFIGPAGDAGGQGFFFRGDGQGGQLDPNQLATLQAGQSGARIGDRMVRLLLVPLIAELETLAGG